MRDANVDNRRQTLVTIEAPASTLPVSSAGKETRAMVTVEDTGTAVVTQPLGIITILLVDDHALMREGLRQLFELERDIQVVGEAADGFDALSKTRQLHPDVVLMDINLPVIDGIAVTRQIIVEFPTIAVIMLTMHHQDQQVVQAMKSGARGYVPKSASMQQLAEAIRAVHAGGMALAPGMTGAIVNEVRRLSDAGMGNRTLGMLSEKELEIVRYVATGMSNKEIAEQLSYSEKTVKNYLSIVFQKLHLRDRTQVAIFALRHGLLPDGWL
ncbi:MAG TPA: response regulator transcription factor [Ktedonosporobacter sp.]|nr:response regulator transcription factor [Ktedonosporobacter sp.]